MPVAVRSTDLHRLYLQALISRRYLTEKLARQLYIRAHEIINAADQEVDMVQFDEFIGQIGDRLSPLGLEIRSMVDDVTGRKMMAIVNTKGDAIAQMATEFTPLEIAYFKLIVECIMLAPSESFSLSSLAALKECSNLSSAMTKTQADGVLNSFVAKGWLIKSKRGRYALSTRSILELQNYLKTTFEDEVLECTICMEICTKGIACSTARCQTRMHTHCYTNYKRNPNGSKCPSCSTDWSRDNIVPVGEDAVKDGEDNYRRRRRDSDDEEEEAEYEEEEEEDEQMDAAPKERRKSGRKAATQKSIAGGYVVEEEESQAMDEDEDEDMEPEATQVKKDKRRKR